MNNIYRHCRSVKFCLSSILLAAAVGVHAEESGTQSSKPMNLAEPGPQIWLTTGFFSHHFKRDKGYNEENTGLGIEVRLDDSNAVVAGIYRNSVREHTHYLQYAWTPIGVGPVRLGAAAGVIDGYPELNNGKAAFALMPIATVNFKIFDHDAGINFVYIPTIAKRVDGALALQLKVRLK